MNLDWAFAARVAKRAAPDGARGIAPARLQDRADDAAARVIAATGMEPTAALPPVEWVTREQWIDANLATMQAMLDPVIERAPTPRGTSPLIETLGSGALALEIGAIVAMLSRRVLGQFEINLLEPERPSRLLMVAPNLDAAVTRMGVPREDFITWVLLHEVTHAVQFGAVPWLRDDLGGALRELLAIAELRPDLSGLLRMGRNGWRKAASTFRDGGLIGALLGPDRRELLERVQGRMGLVEGHAEWTMDAAARGAIADVESLRGAMTRRRGDRAPMLKLLDRLLGMDLKMRQYEQGKAFCDRVVDARGRDGLALAWSSPATAPTMTELRDPYGWLRRVDGPPLAS